MRKEMCSNLNVKYPTFCGIIGRDKKKKPHLYPSKAQVSANKKQINQMRKQQYKQQHCQGATGYADQAWEDNLNDLSSEDEEDEAEFINEANILYIKGNYQDALDKYKNFVNRFRCMDEELPNIFLKMANAFYFTFDLKNALTCYERTIKEAEKRGNNSVRKLAEENRDKIQKAVQNPGNITLADDFTELERLMAEMTLGDN
nr:uncharacterized protein LOC128692761 [Cherax quadricarinatus]